MSESNGTDTMAEKLRALKVSPPTDARLRSRETVEEAIRAYRRGVRVKDIAAILACSPNNIYSALGSWALRHAELKEK